MLRGKFNFFPEEQKLQVGPVPGIGLGLITKYPIRKGEELVRIPEEMILDAESALRDSYHRQQMIDCKASEKTILALYITSIMQMRGAKWSAKQQWAGFVKAMPAKSGTIAQWGARKHRSFLKHILRMPHFIEEGRKICEEFQAYHKEVDRFKSLIEITEPRQEKAFVPATMDWCFGIVDARAIRFGDDGRLGLVPFLDFFNHNPNAKETVKWDPGTRSLYVVAERHYDRGEEVKINYYGSKSTRELFLRHGFTPKQIWNVNDRFEVKLKLRQQDAFYKEKVEFLKSIFGGEETLNIKLNVKEINEQGLRFCCFAACKPPDDKSVQEYGVKIIQKGEYEDMEETVYKKGLNRFHDDLRASYTDYQRELTQSNEQKDRMTDAQLAVVIRKFVDWQHRRAVYMHEKWVKGFAADVRIRELKILNSNIKAVRDKINRLDQVASEEDIKDRPKLGWDLKDSHTHIKYLARVVYNYGLVGVKDFM
eukprot:TRINITY_DN21335_c0_g1_i2.p1 TRINITY_DN21335_c0_g1~~TRINITY_DN21335_c0_g1_i2.p1  ORF type:complete len:549 (-),score=64.61 TRINITY_DN21335_c0_g1_i2:1206-2645(-)